MHLPQPPTKYFSLHSAWQRCSVSVPRATRTIWMQAVWLPTSTRAEQWAHSPMCTQSFWQEALNGCGLVIWGLICKANANYLKLGLSGVEHSLKIAFVLFENHSLAWQDVITNLARELDLFVHCRKPIPFFWAAESDGKRQWRQVTGQSQLRTGLTGKGLL